MDGKQWKQNQRIKRAFLPVITGLLAIMIMLGGCAMSGNSGHNYFIVIIGAEEKAVGTQETQNKWDGIFTPSHLKLSYSTQSIS